MDSTFLLTPPFRYISLFLQFPADFSSIQLTTLSEIQQLNDILKPIFHGLRKIVTVQDLLYPSIIFRRCAFGMNNFDEPSQSVVSHHSFLEESQIQRTQNFYVNPTTPVLASQGTLGPNFSQNDLNAGSASCLAFSNLIINSNVLKIFHDLDGLTDQLLVSKLFKTVFNSVMFLASVIDNSMFFQPKSLHFMAEKA